MTTYTVEATMAPVVDGDWSDLRRMTDVVPGTLLIEDPEQPVLVVPVDAESPRQAAVFMEGVASVAGLTVVRGSIIEATPADFDRPLDADDADATVRDAAAAPASMAEGFQPSWLASA